MIRKSRSTLPQYIHVVFELPESIWADHISLVGDFNNWNPTATPFVQTREGIWRVDLDLPADRRFHFCYLVDGRKRTDFHADAWTNGPGRMTNCVIDTSL